MLKTSLFTLRPEEQQFIPIGSEMGVIVTVRVKVDDLGQHATIIENNEVRFLSTRVRTAEYTLYNKLGQPAVLYIDHPHSRDWEVFQIPPHFAQVKQSYRLQFLLMDTPVTFAIKEKSIETESSFLKDLDTNQLDAWKEANRVDADTYRQLLEITALQQKLVDLRDSIQVREMESVELLAQQERFRENIQVLTAGAAADSTGYQAYAKELSETEEKLLKISEETRTLKTQEKSTQEQHQKKCTSLKINCIFKGFDDSTGTLVAIAIPAPASPTSTVTPTTTTSTTTSTSTSSSSSSNPAEAAELATPHKNH